MPHGLEAYRPIAAGIESRPQPSGYPRGSREMGNFIGGMLAGVMVMFGLMVANTSPNSYVTTVITDICTETEWKTPKCAAEKKRRLADVGLEKAASDSKGE
jgi:hypothetical protein